MRAGLSTSCAALLAAGHRTDAFVDLGPVRLQRNPLYRRDPPLGPFYARSPYLARGLVCSSAVVGDRRTVRRDGGVPAGMGRRGGGQLRSSGKRLTLPSPNATALPFGLAAGLRRSLRARPRRLWRNLPGRERRVGGQVLEWVWFSAVTLLAVWINGARRERRSRLHQQLEIDRARSLRASVRRLAELPTQVVNG